MTALIYTDCLEEQNRSQEAQLLRDLAETNLLGQEGFSDGCGDGNGYGYGDD